jgi:hypothetical protein
MVRGGQRSIFWGVQDGLIAEGRLEERNFSYDRYRRRRGCSGRINPSIWVTRSARKELDRLKDQLFSRLDDDLEALGRRPTKANTKPEYLNWFIGDLRIVLLRECSVVYTFDKRQQRIRLLLVRVDWKRADKLKRTASE